LNHPESGTTRIFRVQLSSASNSQCIPWKLCVLSSQLGPINANILIFTSHLGMVAFFWCSENCALTALSNLMTDGLTRMATWSIDTSNFWLWFSSSIEPVNRMSNWKETNWPN
jgi:hypothetical protein